MSAWLEAEILLEKFEAEPAHVRQVARLADELFLGLQRWHGLGERERGWLKVAALLHDIGWSQTPTGSGHHKHSAQLIAAFPWRTLTANEVKIVAQTARYHRKSLPKEAHGDYAALAETQRRRVQILAGILRVADALDRTHTAVVTTVTPAITPTEFILSGGVRGPWAAEQRTVKKKRDLLELISGKRVRFAKMVVENRALQPGRDAL